MKQPVYAPGTMIGGRYRIDKAIARGGCSIVYRGTHVAMGRTVALKIMILDESAGQGGVAWRERFRREARLASQLRHPNTITTFDYGQDSEHVWYIVMEWVEGASLRNVIRDHGAIEARRAVRITLQILDSLEEAHDQSILHRDLKPSNIMITREDSGDEAKVLDFGLAKIDPRVLGEEAIKLTRDGDFVGTPRYAAPEQLKGLELTKASDIYGVGMVMWEMLTGAPAVPEIDFAVCVQHHLGPTPWVVPDDAAPPALAVLVERALKKDPSKRFQDCAQMRQALQDWLDGRRHARAWAADSHGGREVARSVVGEALPASSDISDSLPPIEIFSPREPVEESEPSEPVVASAPEPRPLPAQTPQRPLSRPLTAVKGGAGGGRARWIAIALVLAAVVAALTWYRGENRGESIYERTGASESAPKSMALMRAGQGSTTAEYDSRRERAERRIAEQDRQETVPPQDLLMALRQKGWSASRPVGGEALAGVSEMLTTRLRFGQIAVDATFYSCEDGELARALAMQASAPMRAERLGLTVVRMSPVGRRGSEGVALLRKHLLESKRRGSEHDITER